MTGLLLIDIQLGMDELDYYGGSRNNFEAESNCKVILEFFRANHLPLFHIQHCSTNADSPLHPTKKGNQIKSEVKPFDSELVMQKKVNSAFIGTNLKQQLQSSKITEVIIIGLTTDHCVSTTARMAANYGFGTTVVSDATAAFCKTGIDGTYYDAELVHLTSLASLNDEFAKVVTTNALLESLK